MSVTVIYEFRSADGRATELLDLLQQGRDFARGVAGCDGFDVYRGDNDPNRFVMIETWESAEAHRQHLEANVVGAGVLAKAVALMAAPPDITDPYFHLL